MKKIENVWLLLAVGVLIYSFFAPQGYDFHFHDTYYVVGGPQLVRLFIYPFLLFFFLYKMIRRRHDTVNIKIALIHILTTIPVLYLLLPPAGKSATTPGKVAISNLKVINEASQHRYHLQGVLFVVFLISQVIFLIYFVTMLIKKPAMK